LLSRVVGLTSLWTSATLQVLHFRRNISLITGGLAAEASRLAEWDIIRPCDTLVSPSHLVCMKIAAQPKMDQDAMTVVRISNGEDKNSSRSLDGAYSKV